MYFDASIVSVSGNQALTGKSSQETSTKMFR